MTDDNDSGSVELTRRRALAGLATIGAASATAGAGTMALFSDSETSSGNTVQAGTLDLTGGIASQSFSIGSSGTGVKPGDQGTVRFGLENSGSINGSLDVGIRNVSVTQAESSEAADEGVTTGEFEITAGTTGGQTNFGPGPGDLITLDEAGLGSPQVTNATPDNGGGDPEVTVDTAADLNAASSGSAEVVLDIDNDGFGEIRVGVEPGKAGNSSHDSDGFYYKRATQSNGFFVGKQSGLPSEVASASYDGDVLTVTLDGSDSDVSTSAIAIGGQCIYPDDVTGPDFNGNQLYTPIVPTKAEGDTFGQAAFNSDSGELMTIDGTRRRFDDVLLLSFTVDPDFATDGDIRDGDETLVSDGYTLGSHEQARLAEGRPSRIGGRQYETDAALASGATKSLVVEWQVPYDAGNAIQGERVSLDIVAELNQEDGQ
jgi:predicted ribosomally synthesized peptide with SipW-like signal peptide